MQFRNRCRSLQQQDRNTLTERIKIPLECYAWKQICNMICDSSELFINISNLEIKYSELMKLQVPGLIDQRIGKELYVFLKTKSTKEVKECLQPQTLFEMMKKDTKKIRSDLRGTVTYFTGPFINELSLLPRLMMFLNLLLFGKCCDEFGFLLPVKAIAQIILYNVKSWGRRNSSSTH